MRSNNLIIQIYSAISTIWQPLTILEVIPMSAHCATYELKSVQGFRQIVQQTRRQQIPRVRCSATVSSGILPNNPPPPPLALMIWKITFNTEYRPSADCYERPRKHQWPRVANPSLFSKLLHAFPFAEQLLQPEVVRMFQRHIYDRFGLQRICDSLRITL